MELKTIEQFQAKVKELRIKTDKELGIFYDRGWGDISNQEALVDLIIDGNGQKPVCGLTLDLYKLLLKDKLINENSLITYKARKYHKIP